MVAIAQKTRVHRQRILRALTYVRNSFRKGTRDIFSGSGTVEVDETYIGGQWENKRHRAKAKGGIRKERLPLYLAEYVWKYNHRNDSIDLQKKLILQQLGRCHV